MIMLKRRVFFISLLFLGFLLCGAVLVFGQYLVNKNITISEETVPNLVIKEGLLSTKDETVNVVRDEKVIATDASLAGLEDSIRFVRESGIDAFAPAIGTAHGVYKGTPKIRV